MSLIHGRSPNGTDVTDTNPVLIGGENAAGNASTLTVESGAALVQVSGGIMATTTPLTFQATNEATQIAEAGVEGKSWYITYINWRVSGTAAVGSNNLAVTLKDDADVVYKSAIPAASPNGTNLQITFPHPLKITEGNSFTLDISSPNNAGCAIYTNLGATNQ